MTRSGSNRLPAGLAVEREKDTNVGTISLQETPETKRIKL